MIPDSELLRYCSVPVLNRGRSIAFSHGEKMRDLRCEQASGAVTRLSAEVAATTTDVGSYRVSVTLDERAGTLRRASCTCPAFDQYGGVCKHVAALVLRYNRTPAQFEGYHQRRFTQTSPALAGFMRRSEARRLDEQGARSGARVAGGVGEEAGTGGEPPAGSVRLELALEPTYRGWKARFKIAGPQASYVLKDLGAFVENMRDGVFCAYGKRLAFTHVPAVLDERSRAAYELLARAFAVRALSQASAPGGWRASVRGGYADGGRELGVGAVGGYRVADREIELCDEEIVELIELYRPVGFVLATQTGTGRLEVPASVEDGDPELGLSVEGYADGGCRGYVVRRGAGHGALDLRFATGHGATYVLVGTTFYRCSAEFAAARELLEAIWGAPEDELFVDEGDRTLFCRTVLPLLGAGVPARVPAELEAMRPVPCRLEFYLDRTDVGLTCDAVAVYGSHRHALLGGVAHGDGGEAAGAGADVPGVAGEAAGVGESGAAGANAGAPGIAGKGAAAPDVAPPRDEAAERRAEELVAAYFVVDERAAGAMGAAGVAQGPGRAVPLGEVMGPYLSTKDGAGVERLLAEGLPALRGAGMVYATPAFDALVAPRPPRVRVGVSVRSSLVELSTIADEVPPHEVSAVLASYRRKRRFHRLKDGTYLDLRQADLSEIDELAANLGLTSAQLNAGRIELPGYHAFHLDAELPDEDKDPSFARYLEDFHSVDPTCFEVPPGLVGTLRPYQVEGFRWLCTVAQRGFGGILADEMGLGKSVQLIAYLLATREQVAQVGPSLIVCPASLVYNWQAEFERFAPELRVGVVAGGPSERACVLRGARWAQGRAGEALIGSDYEVLITSYDLLRRDLPSYEGRTLFCEVLDEAQYIKNHATKVAQAAKALDARHRFALTGTPIENRLSELWSVFDYLMPGILGTYQRFQKRFEQPILDGDEAGAASLRALTAPFILRRLKRDVLADLPDKIDGVIRVRLEGEQRRLYAAHEQRLRESLARTGDAEFKTGKLQILAELTHLRQLCCDPRLLYEDAPDDSAKLAALVDLVATCRDEGAKALVFSQFTSFLDLIAQRLRAEGVPFYTITGSTPKRRRLELVNAFNADNTPVFLISLKAGNTGLNLTGASVVVHADPWWNAAAQNQATDRAHRIGQTRVVSVYQLVACDTIEERILRLQQAKSELAERFVGASSPEGAPSAGIASLTKDDLLALLG